MSTTTPIKPSGTADPEFSALQAVIAALQGVQQDARQRIFDAAATFLEINPAATGIARRVTSPASESSSPYPSFSAETAMSPKEFLYEKQPRSDVERVAALAYYLTTYRDTPHFKTLDLSKLNTEAAQPKFSNAANSANNAVKQGYLVPTTKGQRQLSAAGERFIAALPDRDAARAAMAQGAPKRRTRATRKRTPARKTPASTARA
jgi:hypothetical protein